MEEFIEGREFTVLVGGGGPEEGLDGSYGTTCTLPGCSMLCTSQSGSGSCMQSDGCYAVSFKQRKQH